MNILQVWAAIICVVHISYFDWRFECMRPLGQVLDITAACENDWKGSEAMLPVDVHGVGWSRVSG